MTSKPGCGCPPLPESRSFRSAISINSSPARRSARILISVAWVISVVSLACRAYVCIATALSRTSFTSSTGMRLGERAPGGVVAREGGAAAHDKQPSRGGLIDGRGVAARVCSGGEKTFRLNECALKRLCT